MIAYQTNENGVYISDVKCVLSPRDDDGTYIIPAGAVLTAPPKIPSGKQAVWNGEKWNIEPIPSNVEETPTVDVLPELPTEPIVEAVGYTVVEPEKSEKK